MNTKILKTSTVFTLSLLVSIALVPAVTAHAESLEITGNGSESVNTVSSSDSNNTNVQSSNNATITNDITINANTGNNNATDNTGGDTSIKTGDVNTSTGVSNNVNISQVSAGCCENNNSHNVISGNGSESTNSVNNNKSSQTNVTIYNNATITNNVNVRANTGRNNANDNTGTDVKIETGDIKVKNVIDNGPVNKALVKFIGGGEATFVSILKISGNGSYSDNEINFDISNDKNIDIDNIADLLNNVDTILNTGDNNAKYNTGGDVSILTGSIDVDTFIKNITNISLVEIVCGCEKEKEKEKEKQKEEIPSKPEAPAPPTTSVGGPGPSAPSAAAPTTLPVTGGNMFLFLLIGSVLMFFLGTYLRLRSGRSPGYSYSL